MSAAEEIFRIFHFRRDQRPRQNQLEIILRTGEGQLDKLRFRIYIKRAKWANDKYLPEIKELHCEKVVDRIDIRCGVIAGRF